MPPTGLVLTGGGARAGYQVGVLRGLFRLREQAGAGGPGAPAPFDVLAGTSAGALIAATLASRADDMAGAVDALHATWSGFHADQVYRTDSLGIARTGARWLTMMSLGWALARLHRLRPRSLLDNAPLAAMLRAQVPLGRLPALIAAGHLRGPAVSASSYTSGRHVTFYQAGAEMPPWTRSNRVAVAGTITPEHLLASAAIPFMFPAVRLALDGGEEWFGDGSMRQTAPLSPAIHLGAERLVAIAAGRMQEPPGPRPQAAPGYPSVAQIGGHAMSSIFLDALAVDAERLSRINGTLALVPEAARARSALRPVALLLIAPSQRLDDIAARHLGALPVTIRALLGALGVSGADAEVAAGGGAGRISGAALASYLLFEADFTRELLALGEADVMARREDVVRFFGW